jgi:archaellum component FlaC
VGGNLAKISELEQHEVHESIQAILQTLQQIREQEYSDESIDRAYVVVSFLSSYLQKVDLFFIRISLLDELHTRIDNLNDCLSSFINGDSSELSASIQDNTDEVLTAMTALFVPKDLDELGALQEAIVQFRSSLRGYISSLSKNKKQAESWSQELSKKVSDLNADTLNTADLLNDLRDQIDEQKQTTTTIESQVNNLYTQIEEKFTSAQSSREAEYTTSQSEYASKFAESQSNRDNLFAEAQTDRDSQFTEAQTERRSQFTEAQTERGSQFTGAQTERGSQFIEAQSKRDELFQNTKVQLVEEFSEWSSTKRDEFLRVLEKIKQEVTNKVEELSEKFSEQTAHIAELVGLAANTSMSGGYLAVANQEAKLALVWRRMAVASMIVLALFAIVVFFVKPEAFSWSSIGERVFVTITVGGFSTYSATQAASHRKSERENRKIQLELTTLGPYINSLPLEVQNNIKTELSRIYFGLRGDTSTAETSDKQLDGVPTTPSQVLKHVYEAAVTEAKQHGGSGTQS